jgi:pimeloyl-ACP methyl ester carboxylesterase
MAVDDGGWHDRYTDLNGMRVHYVEAGTGPTLVLVHGALVWCCAEMTYGAVIGPLSQGVRVVALDMPGYGLTETRGRSVWRAADQGEFLIGFLRTLGAPVDLAGNSHGGWLVQYAAHEAPELVRRLIIINSLNGTSWIPAEYALPLLQASCPSESDVRRELAAFYRHPEIVTDERVRRTHACVVRHYAEASARQAAIGTTPADWNRNLTYRGRHIAEYAEALRQPVLLTWSRENRGASVPDAVAFYDRLRWGEMHAFTGAGHHVMTEYPERWSAVVRDFLASDDLA